MKHPFGCFTGTLCCAGRGSAPESSNPVTSSNPVSGFEFIFSFQFGKYAKKNFKIYSKIVYILNVIVIYFHSDACMESKEVFGRT